MNSPVREISVSGYMMTSLIIPRKISIRNAFAPLLFWFLSFMPWDHALFVKEHQRNAWNKRKMTYVSATQRKVCRKWIQRFFDAFWMQWSLNFCKFQVCSNFVPWSPKGSATMLDPFAQLFQHCWGRARSLRTVYKDLWVVSFPRCSAGPNIVGSCCIRLHTTANTHATTPNIVGATMLGVVASVCPQPLTDFKLCATTRNNIQQHATGCANGRNM